MSKEYKYSPKTWEATENEKAGYHTCECCGKKVYKKNEVAMNLKYFGRTINKFKCKKCLMKDFGWSKVDWDKQVEDFKAEGCKLF